MMTKRGEYQSEWLKVAERLLAEKNAEIARLQREIELMRAEVIRLIREDYECRKLPKEPRSISAKDV
jgi:hypothetical protein